MVRFSGCRLKVSSSILEKPVSWLSRTFGKKSDHDLDRLVRRLVSYQNEATVLDALREATALAPRGDDLGVRAMTEAIRRRSGKREVTFYTPAFGELTVRTLGEIGEAEDKLVELASSRRLLADVAATQNLISAANGVLGPEGMRRLLRKMFSSAGREQGYDFQLLFNQMQSAIKLRHALGERTWTEKMKGESV